MLKDIKEHFLQKKLNKELALQAQNKKQVNKSIHLVGVLTTDAIANTFDFVEAIEAKIEQARNTRVFSFRNYDKLEEKSFKHFTEKDFNWKAGVIDPSLETFLETPFDLLVGYFDEKQVYMELAILKSKASFKVGFAGVNDELFDLVIAEKPTNYTRFMAEMHKYLTILKKT